MPRSVLRTSSGRAPAATVAILGVAAALAACSGGSSNGPPAFGNTRHDGGATDSGGVGPRDGSSSSKDGAPSNDGGGISADASDGSTSSPDGSSPLEASAGGDGSLADAGSGGGSDTGAGGGSDAEDDEGPAVPPICPTGATWSTGTLLSLSTASDDVMGGITPDEGSIAWVVDGAAVAVMIADRASASNAFGTPAALPAATGYYGATKVAISPDGLRVVVVNASGTALGATTRSARTAAFTDPPAPGEVAAIDMATSSAETDLFVDDPVIGAADATFYYSLFGNGSTNTIFESVRSDTSPWLQGTALHATSSFLQASFDEDAQALLRRHPTGIAADDLTLFFWDDVDGTEKATWRTRTTDPFDHVETLGSFKNAVPNATCDKLYYSAPGAGGDLDLFVSTRN